MMSEHLTLPVFKTKVLGVTNRFGNYIGEAEESGEESQQSVAGEAHLHGDEEEELQTVQDLQSMDIDGRLAKVYLEIFF